MTPLLIQVFTVVFGLIIGSFLTACIYRIPYGRDKGPGELDPDYSGEEPSPEVSTGQRPTLTLMNPRRSICPTCQAQLAWWHNIPFFSYLFLRGRCAFCKTPISARYPAVEVLSAVAASTSYNLYDLPTAVLIYAFCAVLIVISFIDIDYYIIPNVITFPGMALGLILGVLNGYFHWFSPPVAQDIFDSLWGIGLGGGFLFLVSEGYYLLRKRIGLGFGDVKLMAMTGLFFGPEVALYGIFVGSLVGSVLGLLLLLLFRQKLGKPLPFGPYLALGIICYLFGAGALPAKVMSVLYGV